VALLQGVPDDSRVQAAVRLLTRPGRIRHAREVLSGKAVDSRVPCLGPGQKSEQRVRSLPDRSIGPQVFDTDSFALPVCAQSDRVLSARALAGTCSAPDGGGISWKPGGVKAKLQDAQLRSRAESGRAALRRSDVGALRKKSMISAALGSALAK